MRRRERILLAVAIAYGLCCGCTHSTEVRAESHEAIHETEKIASKERTIEKVEVGPETITTTVEEFATIEPLGTSALAQEGQSAPAERSPSKREVAGSTPASGPLPSILVKRTVTVDQRGPSVATATTVALESKQATVEATKETQSDKRSRWGFAWWVWAIAAGGLASGAWLLWKARPWGSL